MAQRAETTVHECFLASCVWRRFPDRFPHNAWTTQSAHSGLAGSRVYVCLAVTCHLCVWQNDRGLSRTAGVTRGWNRHRNRTQHRKWTLEKKILWPLLPGIERATFRSRVRSSVTSCILPLFRFQSFRHLNTHCKPSNKLGSEDVLCQNISCRKVTKHFDTM